MEAINILEIKDIKLFEAEISNDFVYRETEIIKFFFGFIQRTSHGGFYPLERSSGYYPNARRKKLPHPYFYNGVHVLLKDRIEIYWRSRGIMTVYFDNYGLAEAKFKEITSNANFIQI